jgi:hypothetical protein
MGRRMAARPVIGEEGRAYGRKPPFLTVIIPAFRRREFLAQAVDSVLADSKETDECEILVIKDFAEPELEAGWILRGVRWIEFGSTTYGETIARALRESNGEVIAFLEDDDRFVPGKLDRIRNLFKTHPTLVYYHNDYREIDGKNLPNPPSSQRRAIDVRLRHRELEIYDGVDKRRYFGRISDSVPEAHVSCVAIRRAALLQVEPILRQLPIGVDFFLFYFGMAVEGCIAVDPSKLTLYRIHPLNSSRQLSSNPSWYPQLVEGSRAMSTLTAEMVRSLAADGVLPLLRGSLAAHRVYVAVSDPSPNRFEVARSIVGLLAHPGSVRRVDRENLIRRAIWSVISPASPDRAA